MILTRQNSMGLTYSLSEVLTDRSKTNITLVNRRKSTDPLKRITVDMPIEELSQCWFNWQMGGQFIQTAFRKLNAEEREFLITGMTPEDWAKTFPKESE